MNRVRAATVTLGLLGLALGGLVLAKPSIGAVLPIEELAASRPGGDYFLVAAVGLLSLAAVPVVLVVRALRGISEVTPPRVEAAEIRSPGEELDAVLSGLPPIRVTEEHRLVHDRVRELAVDATARTHRCRKETARKRIERGAWTDEGVAATFLSPSRLDPPSRVRRIWERLAGRHWFRRRLRATIAALDAIEEDVP